LVLMGDPTQTGMKRIVAIEPDPDRGQALRQFVHDRIGADVVLAETTSAAIDAMREQAADVILTSILLPPNGDSQLTAYLRQCDQAGIAPVLLIPPMVEEHQTHSERRTWRSRLARLTGRGSPPWPPYDPEAVAGRIREALSLNSDREALPETLPATVTALVRFENENTNNARARAQRWAHSDLPWLSSVNLWTGQEVKLLNISSSGILIDSEFKFASGRSTEFQLWGPNKQLIVAARIVRSDGPTADGRSLRYLTAAAFDGNVDLQMPSIP
jgi:hypothetical protein